MLFYLAGHMPRCSAALMELISGMAAICFVLAYHFAGAVHSLSLHNPLNMLSLCTLYDSRRATRGSGPTLLGHGENKVHIFAWQGILGRAARAFLARQGRPAWQLAVV